MRKLNLCVFCSASDKAPAVHAEAASQLGELIGKAGHVLVYGGGKAGLMGKVAAAAQSEQGKVIGVMPQKLAARELAFKNVDEYIETPDMMTRKTEMMARSDAYIGIAGGFGTLDEMLEVMTHKQVGYINSPIVFVNTEGFYDGLFAFFDELRKQHLIHSAGLPYSVVNTPAEALALIEAHYAQEA
jgi:uncharacterized protein (TIGR00730 family)